MDFDPDAYIKEMQYKKLNDPTPSMQGRFQIRATGGVR